MSDDIPIIFLSKRCKHCLTLIDLLRNRDDLNGNYKIVMIDDEPFPDIIKAVPSMISGGELFSAKDIFMMLEQSDNSQEHKQEVNSQIDNQCSSERECSIDGYCKDGSCLGFATLDGYGGDSEINLDRFYNQVQGGEGRGSNQGVNDDIKKVRSSKMDNDYERLLQERGELQPMNSMGGGMRG